MLRMSEYSQIEVLLPSPELAERVVAEAFDAGALGVEERERSGGVVLVIYLAGDCVDAVMAALAALEGVSAPAAAAPVEDVDWSERWKDGLHAIVVSPRLVVRPSFVTYALAPRQQEVVIDPSQAFGTGGHASTLLALEWIDVLCSGAEPPARVLDVGTGSGVLAFAALKLDAKHAVGFDLDAVAVVEAARAAVANGLGGRFAAFAGPIEALNAPAFDCVVVNMLRRETLPIARQIAARVSPAGRLVLSGLLESDRSRVASAFASQGLELHGERTLDDGTGEPWIALLLRRRG
jgi:ribosomal protein L11 methyltransferase